MRTLTLSSNKIEFIADRSFEDMSLLTYLFISSNKLLYIGKNTLTGLKSMTNMYASGNDIHTIENMAFWEQDNLETLHLSSNNLKTLSKLAFDPNNLPTNLKELRLNSNPLECDCGLVWLKKADNSWVTVWSATTTVCTGPAELTGRTWDSLTVDEMINHGEC